MLPQRMGKRAAAKPEPRPMVLACWPLPSPSQLPSPCGEALHLAGARMAAGDKEEDDFYREHGGFGAPKSISCAHPASSTRTCRRPPRTTRNRVGASSHLGSRTLTRVASRDDDRRLSPHSKRWGGVFFLQNAHHLDGSCRPVVH